MGLLDDAIREHLDLKRRRGADPAEVERAEREALGPVRRGPDPATDAELREGLPYDDEADEDWEEPFDADEESSTAATIAARPAEPLESPELPRSRRRTADEAGLVDDDNEPPHRSNQAEPSEDDPEEPTGGPAPHRAPGRSSAAGDETVEFRVEDAAPREGEDDVLEETPEFLQDAPEHDRLWFEQRPPRDFDFDG